MKEYCLNMISDRDDEAAYRDAHFPFIALQRAFAECQTNPLWEDTSFNWIILTSEGDRELPVDSHFEPTPKRVDGFFFFFFLFKTAYPQTSWTWSSELQHTYKCICRKRTNRKSYTKWKRHCVIKQHIYFAMDS